MRWNDLDREASIGKLTKAFVLTKLAYRQKPTRYEYRSTDKGRDLYPLIMAMVHWGDTHMAAKAGRPVLHRRLACGALFDPVLACSECGQPVDARGVHVLPGPGAGDARHLVHEPAPRTVLPQTKTRSVNPDAM